MKFRFKISGIDCPVCAAKLAEIMSAKDGIDSASINFLAERLSVVSDLDESEVLDILRKAAKSFSSDIVIEK